MHFYITIKFDNTIRLQYSNTEAAKDLLTHQNANKICGKNHTYKKIASSHSNSHFLSDIYTVRYLKSYFLNRKSAMKCGNVL